MMVGWTRINNPLTVIRGGHTQLEGFSEILSNKKEKWRHNFI